MGQITSGVGLVSGIPIADLVDQLIAIEARPKQLVEQRIAVLQSQQVAFAGINANLLNLKLSAGAFASNNTFNTTSSASSDESVLTVTSSSSATPGTYSFVVDRLVTTQQMISTGRADQNVTAVGAGTLTFEFGDARLDTDTDLTILNGGAGVTRGKIRITDRSGASAVIDLSRIQTVNDVISEINNASGISVTASVSGDSFVIDDNSGSTTTSLSVSDVAGSGTTATLGLDAAAVGDTLTGSQVGRITSSTSLSLLNDGQGVDISQTVPNHFQITRRDSTTHTIDLTGVTTVGELLTAIDTQTGSVVTAAIDAAGTGIELTDTGADLGTTFEITALNSSNAAADLGILGTDGNGDGVIESGRLLATLNSKLVKNVNGGSGATLGTIRITDRAATATDIDLSSAGSVGEVISRINSSGASVVASLNQAGNGLLITDQTGSTANDLIIADVSGTAAADLSLAGSYTADEADSGNLQFRYINGNTLLASLNGGLGVSSGQFTITDSSGSQATVDLSQGNETTVQDVIDEINSRGLQINARVNDNGDGILIEDTGPGTVTLTVAEDGSTTARDLGLLGEAAAAGQDLDGSFEKTVTIDADDTLQDVVTKIGDAGLDVSATIINDGSAAAPFRLSLSATRSGKAGAFVFDDGAIDFGVTTLSQGKDAVIFFGSDDPATGIAIRSSTNTLNSVVPGATIDLNGTSATAEQVTISRDDSAITSAVQAFVENFNGVIDQLDSLDSFDAETETRGLLLGDSTISVVRGALFRMANGVNSDLTGQFTTLSQVGIRVGSGARLEFNETTFLAALEDDRDAVEQVFTFKETETDSDTGDVTITEAGILPRFDELIDTLTDVDTGTLTLRIEAITVQVELGNDRVEQLDIGLAAKRARLEAQFLAMELAIAQLQTQSTALASLQQLASQASVI